jgi:hypothetical protein
VAEGEGGFQAFVRIAADLKLSIGKVADELARQRRLAEARIPVDEEFTKIGTFVTGSNLIMKLHSPPFGMVSHLKRVVVLGATGTAAPAGVCTLFRRGSPPYLNGDAGVVGFIDQTATTFPTPAFYSTHQVVIARPDALYAVITGGTNGQAYTVTGAVEVYDERAFSKFIE